MTTRTRSGLTVVLLALLPAVAVAGTARVQMKVIDQGGKPVPGGLFIFSLADDPTRQFTVDENELGKYETSVELPGEDTTWNLAKVVVEGMLPVRIGIRSSSAEGGVVQEVEGMELNPGIPIPPIRVADRGTVRIDLTLGDKHEILQTFLKAREEARARQEQQARPAPPPGGEAYATALSLYGKGDVEGSLLHFEQAVKENPDDLQIRLTHANVLYKARRFEQFESAAEEVLKLDPGNRELWMMLYSSRRDRGEMQSALDALLRLIELQDGDDEALLQHLTFVAKKLRQGGDALRAYGAILQLDPDNLEACIALASLHAESGQPEQSERYLKQALNLAPQRAPGVYFELGSKLLGSPGLDADGVARVIDLLRRSIELDPRFPDSHKKLGLALWKAKDYPGARAAFETYLRLVPNAPDREQIAGYLETLPE